jgi:hypothetical protein
MKTVLLSALIICCCSYAYCQSRTADIYCSIQFEFRDVKPVFNLVEQSSFSRSLPDSLSNNTQLQALGTFDKLPEVLELMSRLGWHLAFSNDVRSSKSSFLVFGFKKQVLYTKEMAERIRKEAEAEKAKHKYIPD